MAKEEWGMRVSELCALKISDVSDSFVKVRRKELFGHEDISTTDRYTHVAGSRLKNAFKSSPKSTETLIDDTP